MQIRFVDSHVHLDHVAANHRERIQWMRDTGCAAVSWAWSDGIANADELARYLDRKARTIRELSEHGLCCRYLCGVHPRNITRDLTPDKVEGLLLPFLDDPLCAGLGELGLETGDQRERDIFIAQLCLAAKTAKRQKIMGVHTPRHDKERVTKITLDLLQGSTVSRDRVVVDHATDRTMGAILAAGYFAGVTISPIKISAAVLSRMVEDHPAGLDRIMANTDSGTMFYEDLARFRDSGLVAPEPMQKITRDNALAFFGLKGRGEQPEEDHAKRSNDGTVL